MSDRLYVPASELERLAGAARAGEEDAWRTLHTRLTPLMRAEARRYRLCPTDVDEVVQFAWCRCFENLAGMRSDAALPGWLLATCRHRALHLVREQRRCPPSEVLPERLDDGAEPGPLEVVLERDHVAGLRAAVERLPAGQRTLLLALLAAERTGHGYAEVAEELAIPRGSIGPTRRRAVATLRRMLPA